MNNYVMSRLQDTAIIIAQMQQDTALLSLIESIAGRCAATLRSGGKLLFAGNGGSAADCQHLAGELVSRFAYDRPGLSAFALTTDTSVLTAIGNDYGYDKLFARQIQAVGQPGDVLFAISTSGKSANILAALQTARENQLITVSMTGSAGGHMVNLCDYCIRIPSDSTPKIQEGHIVIGHIICGLIEDTLFGDRACRP